MNGTRASMSVVTACTSRGSEYLDAGRHACGRKTVASTPLSRVRARSARSQPPAASGSSGASLPDESHAILLLFDPERCRLTLAARLKLPDGVYARAGGTAWRLLPGLHGDRSGRQSDIRVDLPVKNLRPQRITDALDLHGQLIDIRNKSHGVERRPLQRLIFMARLINSDQPMENS